MMKNLKEIRTEMKDAGYTCKMCGRIYEFYKNDERVLSLRQTLKGFDKGQIWQRDYDEDFRPVWIPVSYETIKKWYL